MCIGVYYISVDRTERRMNNRGRRSTWYEFFWVMVSSEKLTCIQNDLIKSTLHRRLQPFKTPQGFGIMFAQPDRISFTWDKDLPKILDIVNFYLFNCDSNEREFVSFLELLRVYVGSVLSLLYISIIQVHVTASWYISLVLAHYTSLAFINGRFKE